jgi:tetratricopeptide (TPR) repeat protein
MNFRSLSPLLLLATQSALPGWDAGLRMRHGDEALAAGLWEMAALHFEECLTDPSLKRQDHARVAIRLAEAWIRDSKAAEALALLGESFVSGHPEAPFWKGQALAGLGRYGEAVDLLSQHFAQPGASWRSETAFTLVNLQLALEKPDAALEILHSLAPGAENALSAKIRLHLVEILLDLGRADEARKTMATATVVSPTDHALGTFLEAQ